MNRDEILSMPAGVAMDVEIAVRVFGMRLEKNDGDAGGSFWVGNCVQFGDMPPRDLPCFSTDISAAWKVIEKLTDGETPNDCELRTSVRGWRCDLGIGYAGAETAPLAICRAALVAINEIMK